MQGKEPIWIVENWAKEQSYRDLISEIKTQGFELIELRDYNKADFNIIRDKCSIFLGSIQMTEQICRDHYDFTKPLVWHTYENYLCSHYYPYFGNLLFNDKYVLVPLIDFHRNKFFFYGSLGKEGCVFIRPDSGDKPFQAQVLDFLDQDSFIENHQDMHNKLVLISTPKNILGEWRFVVTNESEIIACSTYRYRGQVTKVPSAPKEATKKCEEVLEVGFYPDRVFCIDICEDSDGAFYLLELNSFSSAGLYECNKKKIVKRVSEIALEYKKIIVPTQHL